MKKMMYLFSTLLLILAGVEPVRAQWIEPAQYQDMLGRGVDVEWWTDGNDYSSYDWDEILSDYSDAGIQHVRITLENDVLTDYDFDRLDRQVNACLRYNIVPIIAFRPRFAHGGQPVLYRNRLTSWWRIMAEHYRGYPARLSFDILIEPNSSMFATTALLNDFYEDCVSVIRVSNPYRILFIAPTYNSDPMYLRHLRIPSRHNGYLMAEWHFLSTTNVPGTTGSIAVPTKSVGSTSAFRLPLPGSAPPASTPGSAAGPPELGMPRDTTPCRRPTPTSSAAPLPPHAFPSPFADSAATTILPPVPGTT